MFARGLLGVIDRHALASGRARPDGNFHGKTEIARGFRRLHRDQARGPIWWGPMKLSVASKGALGITRMLGKYHPNKDLSPRNRRTPRLNTDIKHRGYFVPFNTESTP